MQKFETIIGLEIHLQLKTKSKMFCSCSNDGENQKQNTTVCPICLGHPGTLPTVNEAAVKFGMKMALALNCKINQYSKFDRKNYFYPDLPKGYQISQFDEPLAEDGHLIIETDGKQHRFGIERLHLEEDAGKNIHKDGQTLVDFNRAGTPLAEIVTDPDFRSPAETKSFLQDLRLIARYLDVSDADMEKGHLRVDANISLRPKGDTELYHKTEVKNLNSFKAVEKALLFEEKRQKELWQADTPPQFTATRGWDEAKQETVEQRTKEGFSDYRFFPEPDLLPLKISDELLESIKSSLPELPHAKQARLATEYGLTEKDAKVLVAQKNWANFYEQTLSDLRAWVYKAEGENKNAEQSWEKNKDKLAKLAYNWLSSELFGLLGSNFNFSRLKITPENMAELLSLVYKKKINSSAATTILAQMFKTGEDPSDIAERLDLAQIDDVSTLSDIVIKILMMYPKQVEELKSGKEALLKFFVGKVMAESKGKANPKKVEEIIKEKI
ncbi:Asp-tRNA(Asn)/Glu-tRNA(Gln) amidotransferase subunit GatB [bacterium]|jgi:aspartyl-tRNA(Asn)/glutamyl-tRNA(Gln) amidotransferase subunit B|nr:Asp-tRNA(Asn)/Glu-tRNA(Gln) amidotransferase subunit GatB [bacterium]MBT4649313.1 Asp-tRNA(Asn)/Glu-tRNA(Gln) amidotransferase subunit GatB [bacterium]MBT7553615.1 Asp-tRNA(Asn)/Glu-tRNA(Gln) amidotransferase subunit GatB [bacterium]